MAQAEVGALRVTLAMNAGEFDRATKRAGSSMDRLAKKAKMVAGAVVSAFATAGFFNALSRAERAWGVQDKAVKAVEGTLKSTGATVGFTSKQLQEMAQRLQEVSVYGDEEILQKLTNNLLTFGNIVGPIFDRAQKAAIGLSSVLNQDLQSSAIQLGKALNDPILGITALSRVGIAFTQQQKDQIKALVQSGQVMKAQGVILAEIEHFYGKAAKAARESAAGIRMAAENDIGDAFEVIGKDMESTSKVFYQTLSTIAKAFQELNPGVRKFITGITGLTTALAAGITTLSVFGVSLGIAMGPLALIITAIAAIGAALYAWWPQLKQTAKIVAEVVSNIFSKFKWLTDGLIAAYDRITGVFKGIYTSAKAWLVDAFKPIVDWVNWFIRKIANLFYELGEITGFNENIARPMADSVNKAFEFTANEVTTGFEKIKNVWTTGSAEVAETMQETVAKWKAPIIEVKKTMTDAEKEIVASQNRLVENGVRLTENLKTPYDLMIEKIRALQAAQAAGKITAEQYGQAQTMAASVAQNAYAGMASNIASSLESVFGESKAFAIVSAVINTYQAFTNALATFPPPYSYVAAAAALAAGFAKVAAIKSTTKNSKGASGGTGSGATASGTGGAGDTGGAGANTQSLHVQGINSSDLFTGEAVRELAGKLLDFQRDGGKVVFE